jgi:uncharacterized protein with GYD domain
MAIVITQARFAAKGPQGVAAKPQDGLDAAGRLVAWIGGTLIASYRTSGDHDVLFIFEADSYDEAIRALGAAASGSDLADLKTVRVLASRETKPAMSGAEGASAAKLAATFSQQWSSASVGADGHWEVLRGKTQRKVQLPPS